MVDFASIDPYFLYPALTRTADKGRKISCARNLCLTNLAFFTETLFEKVLGSFLYKNYNILIFKDIILIINILSNK